MTVIRTLYDPKPIPPRQFDWSATWGDYDLGAPIGYGATEQEAMRDLIDNYPVDECFRPDGIIEWKPYDDGRGFFRGLRIAIPLSVAMWAAIVWLGVMFAH